MGAVGAEAKFRDPDFSRSAGAGEVTSVGRILLSAGGGSVSLL